MRKFIVLGIVAGFLSLGCTPASNTGTAAKPGSRSDQMQEREREGRKPKPDAKEGAEKAKEEKKDGK